MKLNEDDLYRNSSQYKHWSFTPTQLALQRQQTNIQATERVKANVARQRAQRSLNPDTASASESERATTPGIDNGNGSGGSSTPLRADKEVECLTAVEEMKLVNKFCETALDLGKFINAPPVVTATTIQFLRRFYLYNSPMTYEGQNISRAAMFLASKTEGWHKPCDEYAAAFQGVTRDQVLAPEYLIVQALRFNFEVRHPFRALKGAHLELGEMAKGSYAPLPFDERSTGQIRSEMLRLPRRVGGKAGDATESEFQKRLEFDYGFASHVLKTTAPLTDAYFLYTPSQIWMAAHMLADEALTLFYLQAKISESHPNYAKTLATVRACAELISSHRFYEDPVNPTPKEEKDARDKQTKSEVNQLMKKLRHCRDPDKIDLVKLNKAQKRDAVQDGELEESKAKRRKLGREKAEKEAEDFWGPELPKNGQ